MKTKINLLLAFALAANILSVGTLMAQTVTGTLGSPSATTTIPGNQIPAPAPKFGGVIKEERHRLQALVAADASCRPRARRTCC